MSLELSQWIIGGFAALLVGLSKTGIPGTGILVVTLLAQAFGGRASVGIMLPMLIFGDCFAVLWYRKHAQWDKLVGLLPWVVVGLVFGTFALKYLGNMDSKKDILGMIIGCLVLVMLTLHLLQKKFGERLTPTSRVGTAGTGIAAGFATTISNAAGPIMQVFLSAHKLPKNAFMGTIAWYFFIINLSKVPIYTSLGILTLDTLRLVGMFSPVILVGVFWGKWLLPRISQKSFDAAMLILAALAAVKLIIENALR